MRNDSAQQAMTDHGDRRQQSQVAAAGNGATTPRRRKIDCAGNAEITDRRQHMRGGRAALSPDRR